MKKALKLKILEIISKTDILTGLYYLITGSFRREHKGVLKGKINYMKSQNKLSQNIFALRRNIHRIEKGLLMKPRRDVFAEGFIVDTVVNYQSFIISNSDNISINQVKWAKEVLEEYFNTVKSTPITSKAKKIFESLENNDQMKGYVPYKRDYSKKSDINFEQLLKLSEFRRSVRWYLPTKVDRNLVDNAIKIANFSPSACNRQPFYFRIIDNEELVRKVSEIPGGTNGYAHNIPMIIAVIGDLSAYFDERDRHVIYIDSSLATMAFVYGLEVQGLSSCIINWPDVKEKEVKMKNVLGLNDHEKVIMMISVGYPDTEAKVAYSMKKNIDEIRRYN
ncbi:nitroreductase family protein [Bacillus sp. V3]|nr:nitroreductase family protein [Bacillus sp. V3]